MDGLSWRDWARNLAVGAAAGIVLALIGASDTGAASLGWRLAFWTPLMTLGVLLGFGVSAAVTRMLPARTNIWLVGILVALGVTVLSAGFVIAYSRLVWNIDVGGGGWLRFFAAMIAISAAMTAIMIAVNRPGAVTHAAPAPRARLFERFPPNLKGAELYAVSAEDHYLRLHTSRGSELILMRLADAIAELEGVEGAQTHRSWWVARDAVQGARRQGERLTLALKGGLSAPVSRPNMRPLREAGWW